MWLGSGYLKYIVRAKKLSLNQPIGAFLSHICSSFGFFWLYPLNVVTCKNQLPKIVYCETITQYIFISFDFGSIESM